MKFRKGDICTIEVVVESSYNDTNVRVKPVDGYQDIHLKPCDLTMVLPQFEVGDPVRWAVDSGGVGSVYRGQVLSVANGHLWVDLGGGSFATVMVSKAQRVDEPEHDAKEPAIRPPADGGANIVTKHTGIAGPAIPFDGEDRSGETV
jgi:hypothetical protein